MSIIIIIIIIIIISVINALLEEKEKATGWDGDFTNKIVWTCLYACYLRTNFFFCLFGFWLFLVKNLYVSLEFTVVCKFDKNKYKHLLKKINKLHHSAPQASPPN